MLSVEMKINGTLTVHIYAHNEGYVYVDSRICNYYYEVYEVNSHKDIFTGTVHHDRQDGLVVLVSLILDSYLESVDW